MAVRAIEETVGGQFVSFALGTEEYGIPIMQVQEIIRGIAKVNKRLMILLDIDKILTTEQERVEECVST